MSLVLHNELNEETKREWTRNNTKEMTWLFNGGMTNPITYTLPHFFEMHEMNHNPTNSTLLQNFKHIIMSL